ncbi:MAG: hypothetical protein ABI608_11185 [Rhizomicrobium sp.]
MRKIALAAIMMLSGPAQAARQDWVIRHQPDRFVDRVMMEAWADADKGSARMALYCDTDNGFRVMFLPHGALMPEGPAQVTLTIDGAKPIIMQGDAFGDETTDVVTVHNVSRLQTALSTARHVSVGFRNSAGQQVADQDFSFGDLTAQRPMLMKVCPLTGVRSAR